MTEGAMKVLNFMKKHQGKELTIYDILERVNVTTPTVVGTLNNLVKRGFVEKRSEIYQPRFKGERTMELNYYTLNADGYAYDPIQEERDKQQRLLEEKAARREQRRLAQKAKNLEDFD